jgi:hypothetical protein
MCSTLAKPNKQQEANTQIVKFSPAPPTVFERNFIGRYQAKQPAPHAEAQ